MVESLCVKNDFIATFTNYSIHLCLMLCVSEMSKYSHPANSYCTVVDVRSLCVVLVAL